MWLWFAEGGWLYEFRKLAYCRGFDVFEMLDLQLNIN